MPAPPFKPLSAPEPPSALADSYLEVSLQAIALAKDYKILVAVMDPTQRLRAVALLTDTLKRLCISS